MCTSLTYQMNDQHHFLARTFDFSFPYAAQPVVIPRQFQWTSDLGTSLTFPYGFVGGARQEDNYFFADGVNEKGVAIATLYYPNQAEYAKEADPAKLNLAPHEFIMWVLGCIPSVADLVARLNEIQLVEQEFSLLGVTPPLHFIISDETGASIVVETEKQSLIVKENPTQVMTNSPNLEWHLTNLSNYLALQPQGQASKQIGTTTIQPISQGNGTLGLPGGYTSPERFVRASYLTDHLQPSQTPDEALNNLFQVLNNVTIPKGADLAEDGEIHYTQYRAALHIEARTYFFNPYETSDIYSVTLTEALLQAPQPKVFAVNPSFSSVPLN